MACDLVRVMISGYRLEEWSIIRIWFAGKYFDTAEELLHAWHHDVKGLRSNFHWEFPGKLQWPFICAMDCLAAYTS